jgi:hypothetical protein
MALQAFLNRWATSAAGFWPTARYGGKAHTLTSTSAVPLAGALIGAPATANTPTIGDTVVSSVFIPANATAITVTLTGFVQDEGGTSQTITLTGSTTQDTIYNLDQLVNYAAAAQIQASVADKVVVWHEAP